MKVLALGRGDTARSLADRGWPVFPCEVSDKRPHGRLAPHGLRDASTDLAVIAQWWAAEPEANIGIATGDAAGIFVVDLDIKPGVNGLEEWAALIAEYGDVRTATVRTPGGGRHLYFTMPAGVPIRNSTSKIRPGIDIRGTGGYVVAAGSYVVANGSCRSTGPYTWGESSKIEDAPPWLIARVTARTPPPAKDLRPGGGVPEGRRNAHLTSLAGSMRARSMSAEAIAAALVEENLRCCTPPLPEGEVRQIAASVGRYSPRIGRSIRLRPASEITPRPVKWLWEGRLPLGALSLLGGREGIGKTICAYTIAADITRGRLDGVHFGTPKSVVVAATEDSWEFTIVPRLMAASADLTRIFWVDVETPTGTDAPSLPRDLDALRTAIADRDAALVILDPLLSRLERGLDTHKDAEVRQALEPLCALADAAGVSVLGLIHVNKSTSTDVLNTLMASRAFAAVARAVLFVMQDPDDESIRLLGQGKNNLGRMDVPTLTFKIVGAKVAETVEGDVWTGKLEWLDATARTIRDAVEATAANAGDRTATSEAGDWLGDFLKIRGGCADSAVIKAEGRKAGHSANALKAARGRLQITTASVGFPRKTVWSLPVESVSPPVSEHGPTGPTGDISDNNTLTAAVSPVSPVSPVGPYGERHGPTGRKAVS